MPSACPKPCHGFLLVVLTLPDAELPSGIVLADCAVPRNYEHGCVLAVGPGRVYNNGRRAKISVSEGEYVLFPRHTFHTWDERRRIGFVRDEDLVGIDIEDAVIPANEWVLIDRDRAPGYTGLIAIPDTLRRPPNRGTVRRVGPGAVRVKGAYAGIRHSADRPTVGDVVWWNPEAECYDAHGDEGSDGFLIRAGDLLAKESV